MRTNLECFEAKQANNWTKNNAEIGQKKEQIYNILRLKNK